MRRVRLAQNAIGLPMWRLKALLWVSMLVIVLLVGKLFYVQVAQSHLLGAKARAEHLLARQLDPPRGKIYDRNGVVLASDRNLYRLYADPSAMRERGIDPEYVARKLSPIVHVPERDIVQDLSAQGQWVSIATRLTPDQKDAIARLDIYGLGLDPSPARVYPNGTLAAQVLGFTNFDGVGSYGLEGYYNSYLTGKPGEILGQRDANGNWIALGPRQVTPPEPGADLHLTLDSTIQYYAEQVLDDTVREQHATGGSIIVMDPKTGAILAMASAPTYDPNQFYKYTNASVFVNPAISGIYEPGSTFKIVTMAAGLSEGVITPYTWFNDPGYLNVYGQTIYNWDRQPHPHETMIQVLEHSANVGAAWVAQRVGKDAFYRHLQDFGFGQKTGIDLQGEEDGMLILPSNKDWAPINLLTNAYGQGIGVTPLQLITAEAAVTNGGLLMRPYVVSEITRDGKVIKKNHPVVVRRVMTPQVANTLKGMMATNAEYGEYEVSRVPGYTVGAKTGTASIATKYGYSDRWTVASFIGFSPVKDPRFIILVKIDKPQKSRWGSEVAAPAFRELAKKLYAYMGIPPDKPLVNGKPQP